MKTKDFSVVILDCDVLLCLNVRHAMGLSPLKADY
jgi:hypothetical protein